MTAVPHFKILLLCERPWLAENYLKDSIEAFQQFSRHQIYVWPRGLNIPDELDFDKFDGVILHWSLRFLDPLHNDSPELTLEKLAAYKGLKVWMNHRDTLVLGQVHQTLRQLGIRLYFTTAPQNQWEQLWPHQTWPQLQKISMLPAYVPLRLLGRHAASLQERPLHLLYRGGKPCLSEGPLAFLKRTLIRDLKKKARKVRLNFDLSDDPADRLQGSAWTDLIRQSRAVLATEWGTEILDPSGQAWTQALHDQTDNPEKPLSQVYQEHLESLDGQIKARTIPPICFEAICLRTALVLVEGEYGGILKPHRHYLPLKADLSNFDEILQQLNHPETLQKMVDHCYETFALHRSYGYETLIESFDQAFEAQFSKLNRNLVGRSYHGLQWIEFWFQGVLGYRLKILVKVARAQLKQRWQRWMSPFKEAGL